MSSWVLTLLLAPALAPQPAAGVDQEVEAVCRAIDAEVARFNAVAEPPGKAAVVRRLLFMERIDQIVRNALTSPKTRRWAPDARDSYNRKLAARMDEIDRANTAQLKELIKTYGWFTISEFGKEADKAAWLLVQHADHDVAFQKQVLGILGELYIKGETDAHNYAYLFDRVAGHTGTRQRYGTQGRCTGPGKWEPDEVEDPAALDARRKSVGLPPMRVYMRYVRLLCP